MERAPSLLWKNRQEKNQSDREKREQKRESGENEREKTRFAFHVYPNILLYPRPFNIYYPFFFFFLTFYNCVVPMGFLPREIRVAFSGESQLPQSRYPTYSACWMFQCFHNPPNSDVGYGIFNVRTDVNACDCTRWCTDTGRESALKVDSERKIPCRTGKSNLSRQRDGPTLYKLSYTPTLATFQYADDRNTAIFKVETNKKNAPV